VDEITSLTYNAAFLFQIEGAHEAQRCSTQRMSAFNAGAKRQVSIGKVFPAHSLAPPAEAKALSSEEI
jgi:hypothetical protein